MTRIAVLLVAGLSIHTARADVLHATSDQPVIEVSHTVQITLEGGVAKYVVQRQFKNTGGYADEARLVIELPAGASATGLRIRAKTTWFDGELLDREQAAARYLELTGRGVWDPKDPALLFWLSAHQLALQVFPIMPGATSTVEYTLTVPTQYAAGRYWLTYPRVAAIDPASPDLRKLVTPEITVRAGLGVGAQIAIDGKPVVAGTPVALAPAEPIAARPPAGDYSEEAASPRYPRVVSITVPRSAETRGLVRRATIAFDVDTLNTSDLWLELVTPTGERVPVFGVETGLEQLRSEYEVALPSATRAAGTWQLVGSSSATTVITRCALTVAGKTTVVHTAALVDEPAVDPDVQLASIAIAPSAITTWVGRLGRVVASNEHAFTRFELDAAPRLSALPKHAQVAFVIDASYSVGPERLAAELAIVRAYAAHVPDAELELIAYRRTATRVFGRFVPATELAGALDHAVRGGQLALGNGSALDDGARLAATVLAGRPGPHRVVVLTDELLRSSLTEPDVVGALAALDPAAVVHVVVPVIVDDEATALVRDEGPMFAALAARHHGIFARLRGFSHAHEDLARTVLELVRPTRIDELAATGDLGIADELAEGHGLRVFGERTKADALTRVSLTGKLWSDPIRLDVTEAAGFSQATAAFVFGADLQASLDETEMKTVALAGRAVSPVTSYLAIEPGVRPSTIGFPPGEGWGTIGLGRYGTVGHGGGTGSGSGELEPTIATAACVAKVRPAAGWAVTLAIETTNDEIVDVTVKQGAGAMADCLVESAWTTHLDQRFDEEHGLYIVDLFER